MINAKTENAKAVHTRSKCFVYETGEPVFSKSLWEGRQTLKVVHCFDPAGPPYQHTRANACIRNGCLLYYADDIATNIFKSKVKVK